MSGNFMGLKILVSVMGVLIVIGTGVVTYTIIKRMNAGEASSADAQAPSLKAKRLPLEAFGDVSAKLPAGAVVEEMIAERRRLMVRIRKADGGTTILVFDLSDGRRLGGIELTR